MSAPDHDIDAWVCEPYRLQRALDERQRQRRQWQAELGQFDQSALIRLCLHLIYRSDSIVLRLHEEVRACQPPDRPAEIVR